jgi:hypothetical protein
MQNSNWDTYSEAPAGRRRPPWAKFLIGCGAAALLLVAGLLGVGHWAAHSGRDTVKRFLEERVERIMAEPWRRLAGVVEAVRTDEGALALYRGSPLLKAGHPTEAAFLKSAAEWRAKLADFPDAPPQWMEGTDHFRMSRRGADSLELAYTLPDGTRVRAVWEGGALAEIDVR